MQKIPIRKHEKSQFPNKFLNLFRIKNISDDLKDGPLVESFHRHNFFFLLAIKQGSGNHNIDLTHYKIKDYALFFLRPGQIHKLTLNVECKGYLVNFSQDFSERLNTSEVNLLRKVSNQNYYQLTKNQFDITFTLLTNLFKEYNFKKEGYREVIKANLVMLFAQLARLSVNDVQKKGTPYMQKRLDELLNLVSVHIKTKKKVLEYADMMNLSQYQLNNITKSTIGINCSELIKEQILLEAKRSLLVTTNQISQIANDLGYEDSSHFVRVFKSLTGYTPGYFRDNFK